MDPQKDYLSDINDQENFGYSLASPLNRLAATFIEGIIIYMPLYFVASYIPGYSDASSFFFSYDFFDVMPNLIQTGITALLGAVFYPFWSGNLGHKLLGLKVISAVDGSDQKTAPVGAIREVLKSVLGVFIIPSIWLLWDDKKQNLYDKITKTLVVYKP